jgi:hypothetical protein
MTSPAAGSVMTTTTMTTTAFRRAELTLPT